jgi:hypothetical protein
VAEVVFTAFGSTPRPVTARLIVRRVRDRTKLAELFPVWRHHPFLTDSLEPTAQADITHRRHAIIETVFADLIDSPIAHLPSGRFAANSAWAICAAITHNLLRAAGNPRRPAARHRPRDDAAASPGHRSGPADPAATPPGAAPTRTLALGTAVDRVLGSGVRHRSTHPQLTPTTAGTGPTRNPHRGNAGQTSRPNLPTPTTMINFVRSTVLKSRSTDRG